MVYRDVRVYKTAALSPVEVATKAVAVEEYDMSGLDASRDVLIAVIKPTTDAGLGMVGWSIESDNKFKIKWINVTTGNLTPTASEVYTLVVGRSGSDPTADGDRL
jgi:hypothetical protein